MKSLRSQEIDAIHSTMLNISQWNTQTLEPIGDHPAGRGWTLQLNVQSLTFSHSDSPSQERVFFVISIKKLYAVTNVNYRANYILADTLPCGIFNSTLVVKKFLVLSYLVRACNTQSDACLLSSRINHDYLRLPIIYPIYTVNMVSINQGTITLVNQLRTSAWRVILVPVDGIWRS